MGPYNARAHHCNLQLVKYEPSAATVAPVTGDILLMYATSSMRMCSRAGLGSKPQLGQSTQAPNFISPHARHSAAVMAA